jgi:hypothetical protein
MSIASTTRKAGPFTGNGLTTIFPFTFKVFQASDLLVVRTDLSGVETALTLTTDYTVSLNANQDSNPGGTITAVSAPASGFLLTMTSNVPELQPVVLTNNGGFYPSVINDALDRLTIFAQQISEQVSRSVKVGISSSTNPDSLIASVISSAASAASSAASALSSWNSFQGIYYGALAADPSVDPLGNPCGLGDEYFNTATNSLRIYTSTGWQGTAVASPVDYNNQSFNGTGAQTAFTLPSAPASLLATEVFISGVRQRPTTDYTLSGSTLTFVSAPASGTNNIFVRWTNSIAVGVPNNKSVTYPKIQDVPNQRLLGRNTAAAGDVEEVTLSQLLDWIGSAARGDILFRGASSWQRLAAGTAGYALTTNGAGADPSWAFAGGLGVGQTWQDVTASRVSGTTYTNSTGKPIQVNFQLVVSGLSSTYNKAVVVGGVTVYSDTINGSIDCSVIVPNGVTYSFICTAIGGTSPSASTRITELR